MLAVLPFFHIYGMTVLLNLALRKRASLVTMPKFDLVEFLTNIQKFQCTYLYIAPPIAVALAKHPIVDQFDISSVHTVFSGAAPLDGETAEIAGRRINARMLQGYGMSELSPVSHAMNYQRHDVPVSSVGETLPNEVCKLIDTATGEEITEFGADGQTLPGELWIKGPNVMLGYLNNPEATAETLDADGFLHTGDIAVYHEGGYFSIVDRAKELIKYKGYQIAPAELEALLLGHPKVMDVAVIGVLDDDKQEIPKAFVVAAPDSGLTETEVMEFLAAQVAPHKKVRRVEFIDAIPKSTSGKILRKDLRARELATVVAAEQRMPRPGRVEASAVVRVGCRSDGADGGLGLFFLGLGDDLGREVAGEHERDREEGEHDEQRLLERLDLRVRVVLGDRCRDVRVGSRVEDDLLGLGLGDDRHALLGEHLRDLALHLRRHLVVRLHGRREPRPEQQDEHRSDDRGAERRAEVLEGALQAADLGRVLFRDGRHVDVAELRGEQAEAGADHEHADREGPVPELRLDRDQHDQAGPRPSWLDRPGRCTSPSDAA